MRALILVDLQNDFCPGGALAVAEGDQTLPLANQLLDKFDVVVATQDWHPAHHKSFAANHRGKSPGEVIDLKGLPQVLWPRHCVQGTEGAAFHPALETAKVDRIFQKGTNPEMDSYSGFFDNGRRAATGLGAYLKDQGVDEVFVLGLATDYCVKFTALDAVDLGFKTTLVEDAVRAVNLQPGDARRAVEELVAKGVKRVRTAEV